MGWDADVALDIISVLSLVDSSAIRPSAGGRGA